MKNQEIKNTYEKVKTSLDNALNEADKIQMSGDEENIELQKIREELQEYNKSFKNEIDKLEKSSEWDKFCMAFFGETNAGKSTIIEALRIVYEEETRQSIIDKQTQEYINETKIEQTNYIELLQTLKELNESLSVPEQSVSEKKGHPLLLNILLGASFLLIGIVVGFVMGILLF